MNVIVAKSAGFCMGVRRAVERARELARESGGPVYTDGPLIHNNEMMAELKREGIVEAADPAAACGQCLLVRAHGISPDRRALLREQAGRLVDATCPDVARIQALIRREARGGRHIVIYGDAGHAEVIGLLGFAEGRGHTVTCPDDIAELPDMDRVCLVSQSTQFPSLFDEIAERMRARYGDVHVCDTICVSTRRRQQELVELADRADVLVVVGGAHSANTNRLVDLARSLRPTIHIQTAGQLQPGDFAGFDTAGVTAGASTPTFIIDAIADRIRSF
jgi:4-hydroxy-3-methylbut-2-enyl diphosphate reductase